MADWIAIFGKQLDRSLQEQGNETYRSCGEAERGHGSVPSREMVSELSVTFAADTHPVVAACQGLLQCEVSIATLRSCDASNSSVSYESFAGSFLETDSFPQFCLSCFL